MKTITSRYGDSRTIRDTGGGCFIVEGRSNYYRVAGNEEKVTMYDFEGGPAYYVGGPLFEDNPNLIIEEIIPESTKSGWGKVTIIVKDNGEDNDWR
jgi:hypothetical protein